MIETTYFDMLVLFIYYGFISVFNWVGYNKDIPVIQIGAIVAFMFAIVPFLEMLKTAGLPIYGASTLMFALFNTILFIMGMVKYRQGR